MSCRWMNDDVSLCQESGGSARTDYRAIQLAKKKKQRGPSASSGKTHTHSFLELYSDQKPKSDATFSCLQGVQDWARGKVKQQRQRPLQRL